MIELSHVSKSYKIQKKTGWFRSETQMKCAVKDVSLSIGRGEIVGYIGPNGSGKSTTIKMMSGILLPDEGTIRVNGVDPFYQRKQNGRNIGVLFGQRSQLWWHLKLEDTLNLLRCPCFVKPCLWTNFGGSPSASSPSASACAANWLRR